MLNDNWKMEVEQIKPQAGNIETHAETKDCKEVREAIKAALRLQDCIGVLFENEFVLSMFNVEIQKAEIGVIKTIENLAPIMGYAIINDMSKRHKDTNG